MAYHYIIALLYEGHKLLAGALHVLQLFVESAFLSGAEERIPAEGNHCKLTHSQDKV